MNRVVNVYILHIYTHALLKKSLIIQLIFNTPAVPAVSTAGRGLPVEDLFCRVELRQRLQTISGLKKDSQCEMSADALARSWREPCSCHSGSLGHWGPSCEPPGWMDHSHGRCLDLWTVEATLCSRVCTFKCAKQLRRRKAEFSALCNLKCS